MHRTTYVRSHFWDPDRGGGYIKINNNEDKGARKKQDYTLIFETLTRGILKPSKTDIKKSLFSTYLQYVTHMC